MIINTAQKPNERDVWVKGLSYLVVESVQSSYLVQEHRLISLVIFKKLNEKYDYY